MHSVVSVETAHRIEFEIEVVDADIIAPDWVLVLDVIFPHRQSPLTLPTERTSPRVVLVILKTKHFLIENEPALESSFCLLPVVRQPRRKSTLGRSNLGRQTAEWGHHSIRVKTIALRHR
jgi:hypothetical protein